MVIVDGTIVNIAIPEISRDMGVPTFSVTRLVLIYLLWGLILLTSKQNFYDYSYYFNGQIVCHFVNLKINKNFQS